MKKFSCLILLTSITLFLHAQVSLVGMKANPPGGPDVVTWQALDSTSVSLIPTSLSGVYLNSSMYDAYNGNYYLNALNGSVTGLFAYNTVTGTQGFNPLPGGSNITALDMSTGKVYTLSIPVAGQINVSEYDLATGGTLLLGTAAVPGVTGLVVDATAFDSDNGVLFSLLPGTGNNYTLLKVLVRSAAFSFSTVSVPYTGTVCSFTGLNYDNVNDHLYARRYQVVSGVSGNSIVTIDENSGTVNALGPIPGLMGFVVGASAFDQNSGCYLTVGVDSSNVYKMVVFDTYHSTSILGFAPYGVSEIECNNYEFAQNRYVHAGIGETGTNGHVSVYPVPCSDRLTISPDRSFPGGTIELLNLQGELLISRIIGRSTVTLDVAALQAGIYMLRITANNGTVALRKVVKN